MARRKRNNDAKRQAEIMLGIIEYQQGMIDLIDFLRKCLSEFYRRQRESA